MPQEIEELAGPQAPGPAERRNPFRARLEREVDAATVAKGIEEGTLRDIVIDLRSPDKFREGHVPGAINAGIDDLAQVVQQHGKDRRYITMCYHIGCMLSTRGAARLADEGVRVRELLGGWKMWQELGYPAEQGEGRAEQPRMPGAE